MSVASVPRALVDLPRSASRIYLYLRDRGHSLTVDELADTHNVSRKTVRRGLADLEDADLVERVEHPTDGRRCQWRIARDDTAEGSA